MDTLAEKYRALQEDLCAMGSVAVAFSGGVDSTLLLKVAHDLLGQRAFAVTAVSCSFPERERSESRRFCEENGITQVFCQSEELEIEGFRSNPVNRCYLCKRELFEKILAIAGAHGVAFVAEGSNLDDEGDYRPGMRAIRELGITSPLRKAGMTKADIRALSKALGLPTWEKPSFACLASRFVYGEEITSEKLSMVDQAEQLLLNLGFQQVRVRIHGKIARIEVAEDALSQVLAHRALIYDRLKSYGFSYVTLDLKGYRTGSMNETLDAETLAQK